MNLLIVEDSRILKETLTVGLRKMGYGVDAVGNGAEGLEFALVKAYDVVILDLMLPGMDGLTVLRKLREKGRKTHVLILSAKDQVEDRIRGLQLGADDYLVKPFSFEELCARIGSLIRRTYSVKDPEIVLGRLHIQSALREVRGPKGVISLTPTEYALLEYLAYNRGRVATPNQLLENIYGADDAPGTNVIQVMVCNLRRKLLEGGASEVIQTRRGYGYFVE